jgi:hypothetical protein
MTNHGIKQIHKTFKSTHTNRKNNFDFGTQSFVDFMSGVVEVWGARHKRNFVKDHGNFIEKPRAVTT